MQHIKSLIAADYDGTMKTDNFTDLLESTILIKQR